MRNLVLDCSGSLFIRGTTIHDDVIGLYNGVNLFRENICQIFVNEPSYYSVFDVCFLKFLILLKKAIYFIIIIYFCFFFEIVSGRSDLPSIIDGTSSPLRLLYNYSTDEHWSKINNFITAEQLVFFHNFSA